MLDGSELAHGLQSATGEETADLKDTSNGMATMSRSSEDFSPSSVAHASKIQNHIMFNEADKANGAFFEKECGKTKRKYAKRTCFVGVLASLSGNDVDLHLKKRKQSAANKLNGNNNRKASKKVTFRKHSISNLLPRNATTVKQPIDAKLDDQLSEPKEYGTKGGAERRRRSKRERHLPQKLGPSELTEEVNDRDVVFGRRNHGTHLVGNQLLFKKLCESMDDRLGETGVEKLRLVADQAIKEVKDAGGRFLEFQTLSYHVSVSNSVAFDHIFNFLQELQVMRQRQVFDEDKAIRTLGATTEMAEACQKQQSSPSQSVATTRESIEAHLDDHDKSRATLSSEEKESQIVCSAEKIETVQIGSIINVFWPLDQRSYAALVLDKDGNSAQLRYLDDGLSEWIDLSKNWFDVAEENGMDLLQAGSPGSAAMKNATDDDSDSFYDC